MAGMRQKQACTLSNKQLVDDRKKEKRAAQLKKQGNQDGITFCRIMVFHSLFSPVSAQVKRKFSVE